MGLSEVGPTLIRKAHAIHPLTCVEQEWSLWSRDIEAGIVPTCRELGIGIMAYSPLGRGFLTGQLTPESLAELPDSDWRKHMPRAQVWRQPPVIACNVWSQIELCHAGASLAWLGRHAFECCRSQKQQ